MPRPLTLALWIGIVSAPAAGAPDRSAGVVDAAAAALSVYRPGEVPATPLVFDAIARLGAAGSVAETALLDDLARSEGTSVGPAAAQALEALDRLLRAENRARFVRELPSDAAIEVASRRWRARGFAPVAARCAAYTEGVLGADALDARAVRPAEGPAALAARGAVREAVLGWADAAAAGSDEAYILLRHHGVDPERLVIGLVVAGRAPEPAAFALLARRGEALTAEALAERLRDGDAGGSGLVVDALGRMLVRDDGAPLSDEGASIVRKALQEAPGAPPRGPEATARAAE